MLQLSGLAVMPTLYRLDKGIPTGMFAPLAVALPPPSFPSPPPVLPPPPPREP